MSRGYFEAIFNSFQNIYVIITHIPRGLAGLNIMSREFDNSQPVETPAQTRTEKAIRQIEHYIAVAALDSPLFQAFADYTDRLNAEQLRNHIKDDRTHLTLCLIEETIRQRKNGVRWYKRAFEFQVRLLQSDLKSALMADGHAARHVNRAISKNLTDIKEQAIERKNMRLSTPQP